MIPDLRQILLGYGHTGRKIISGRTIDLTFDPRGFGVCDGFPHVMWDLL
jgi:hypothetical protein